MAKAKTDEVEKTTPKFKIVAASEYYNRAREVQAEYGNQSVRDIGLVLLHEDWADKIIREVNDKSGDVKFVVKL